MKNFFKVLKKRAKYFYTEELDDNSNEIPPRYWHHRDGLNTEQSCLL